MKIEWKTVCSTLVCIQLQVRALHTTEKNFFGRGRSNYEPLRRILSMKIRCIIRTGNCSQKQVLFMQGKFFNFFVINTASMEQIRSKMDEVKDKIDAANALADDFEAKNAIAAKTLEAHHLHIEDIQRHMKSLEQHISTAKNQLKESTARLEKTQNCEEDHVKAVEIIEAKGEVHDSRIDSMQQRVSMARRKYEENYTLLEEGKRKVCVLKREVDIMEEKVRSREDQLEDLESVIRKDDGLISAIEAKNDESLNKEYDLEDQIEKLKTKIEENNSRIDFAERKLPSLQYQIETIKKEICDIRNATSQLKNEITTEIHEMVKTI